MNKNWVYWILQVGGWSLYAILNIYILNTVDKLNPSLLINLLLEAAFFLVSTHLLRRIIIQHAWLKLSVARLIPKVLLSLLILTFFNYTYQVSISYYMGIIDFQSDFKFSYVFFNISASYFLYFLWTLIYLLYHYIDQSRKALKFEAAINEIELNKLKSQLNPHFIFNALNSIRALVDENPGKAKIAITQLSNILRNSLMLDKKKLIKFNDEIKTVKDYLELENIRFEERLKTELKIHKDSGYFEVPPLMIQTLVENGIKHGISNLVEGGLLQVSTEVKNSLLYIRIRNSGQYVENGRHKKNEGYGIDNTKQRLKLIYGESASFKIGNEGELFVLTEVVIPRSI